MMDVMITSVDINRNEYKSGSMVVVGLADKIRKNRLIRYRHIKRKKNGEIVNKVVIILLQTITY